VVVPDDVTWGPGESPCDRPPDEREGVTVTIPWVPPSNMLPNAITSTRTGNRHRRQVRKDAAIMLRSAINEMFRQKVLNEIWPPFVGPTHCRITVAWGKERTHGKKMTGVVRWRQTADPDNLLAAMKGALDALADVGLIRNDRDLIHAPIEQVRDPEERGFTTVELWQEGDGDDHSG